MCWLWGPRNVIIGSNSLIWRTPPPPKTPQTLPLDPHPQLGKLPWRRPQGQHRNRCTDTNTDSSALRCMPSPRAPPAAHATRCKVVVRKPGDFWRFFPAAQLRCAARGCGRHARKRHGGASKLQHPRRARRARSCAASAREGSRKIRAARRAQDRRSPLTVKRTRAHAVPTPQRAIAAGGVGSRSSLRGTGARNGPAKVAHPLALGVTGASAWSPADIAPAPPRPAPPPERVRHGPVFEDNFFFGKTHLILTGRTGRILGNVTE
jgi:hypothetical protein